MSGEENVQLLVSPSARGRKTSLNGHSTRRTAGMLALGKVGFEEGEKLRLLRGSYFSKKSCGKIKEKNRKQSKQQAVCMTEILMRYVC